MGRCPSLIAHASSCTWLMVAIGVLGASSASAAGLPDSRASAVMVRLQVLAPSDCMTPQQFTERVASRSARIHFVTDDDPSIPTLRVEIETHDESAARATLELVDPKSAGSVRTVEANGCEQARDALALIAVVTLDPGALTQPTLSRQTQEPTNSSRPAAPVPPARVRRSTIGSVLPQQEPISSVKTTLGAIVGASYGPTPDPAPGAGLVIGLDWPSPTIWAPAVFAMAGYFVSPQARTSGGIARFSVSQILLELCSLRLGSTRLALRVCAATTMGYVHAEGRDTSEARSSDRVWSTLGAAGVLEAFPIRHLGLAATWVALAPLRRDSYQFAPNVFFRVPAAAILWTLGPELRFD